ncbi:MAG TPA: TonB family protein [Polyangiaceae bacterium]|nr:TonB family protein [Polyangiaceae bacterium]
MQLTSRHRRAWNVCRAALLVGFVTSGAVAQEAPAAPSAGPADPAAPAAASETSPATTEPRKPVVVMPVVDHYQAPVYPLEAELAGVQASVRLALTVDVDGSVAEAKVIEPVGYGLDEAALDAAKSLHFAPATVDGTPRKVRIEYRYDFAPASAASPEAASEPSPPAETISVGNLAGRVVLGANDSPLPGVAVRISDDRRHEWEVRTDADGRWQVEGLPAGRYRIDVAAEGFRPVRATELVEAGHATDVLYRLAIATTELEVVVEGERPPREVTKRTLERREISRIPGTSGDAIRSIQSLPGVARPPGLAGLLIVRGSAPADTETFVDGSNVPLIYHFGGLSSVVPTELLDKIDFYPGNFSVRYGRLTGGVVDVALRKPNTDCYGDYGEVTGKKGCYHGMAQVDLIDGRLMLQGPLLGAKDWSFAVAGRRSWIDTWLKPVLEGAGSSVTSAPVYYDYQAIVERNKGPGDKLSFRFFGSDDRFETIINSPSASDPGVGGQVRFATSFYRGQILYKKDLTKAVSLDSMLSVGGQVIDFGLGGNLKLKIETIPIVMRSELGFRLHETTKLNVGLDFLAGPFDVEVRAPPLPRPGEAAQGPLATTPPRETSATGFSFRPGWYADVEWVPSKRWRVVPGGRVDYAQDTGHADISPRLNARYWLVHPDDRFWGGQPLKTVLKAGVGKFSQPPAFQETDPVFGTPGLYSNQAIHYAAGVEQGLSSQIEISVEGFYKDLYGSVSRSPNQFGAYSYGNQGSGQVIGLETLLKYNPDGRFFGWIAYTVSESLRRNCQDLLDPACDTYRFQYDQTHNLIILGSYRLGDGWEFGARFRIVSGPLTTPKVPAPALPGIYSGDAGTYLAVDGQAFSERLPLFHQLDVRIDKRWQFRTWRLNTYVDVQNVYNHAAVEAYVYNYDYSQKAYQTGLPFLPSFGVRGEF